MALSCHYLSLLKVTAITRSRRRASRDARAATGNVGRSAVADWWLAITCVVEEFETEGGSNTGEDDGESENADGEFHNW
jgi:hypothetical protein